MDEMRDVVDNVRLDIGTAGGAMSLDMIPLQLIGVRQCVVADLWVFFGPWLLRWEDGVGD